MRQFGLTGGIGSGKSTVAAGLVRRGAALIDADAVVRELQIPGGPVLEAMVLRFGPGIVAADGTLDRAALAAIVFSNPDELKALNDIVHPAVAVEMARQRDVLAETESSTESEIILVTEIPLLVRADGSQSSDRTYKTLTGIVVVDCDTETAISRLVQHRGFAEADAVARVANQASREDRRAVADWIVDNSGDRSALEQQLDRCWSWMESANGDVTAPQ